MNALVLGEKGYAQAIRAWKFSKSSGSQTMPRLERKKKFEIWDIVIIVHTGGKKFIFPRFRLIAPERKHFHCAVMIGNTCGPHPT